MLTLRVAAALLAQAASPHTGRTLLAPLGFSTALPVSDTLRTQLGLDARVGEAELVTGPGALRAFSFMGAAGCPIGELVDEVTRQLQARAPHVLWLVLGMQSSPGGIALAVPRPAPPGGVAALVVDRSRVVDSDAETLASLAAVQPHAAPDLTIHARWVELLGRDALNRRFYRALEQAVRGLAADARGGRNEAERDEAALLCGSRLLFLAFLQGKGWLAGDRQFLVRMFDESVGSGGDVHRRALRPLFFGTLNTPWGRRAPAARAFGAIPFLNGGLFAPARCERGARAPRLSDAMIGRFLHDVLGRYRFTAHEGRATYAEAAVDPEMIGRAFESLMASRERRDSGTFYTPSGFGARLTRSASLAALEHALPAHARRAVQSLVAGERVEAAHASPVREALREITVLDPACGSGSLLVHALTELAAWTRLAGDTRPPDAIRRDVLARCIFGVDRDATAVWLCELRLWLAIAVECEETDPRRVTPLPNLDRNIRVGDTLLAPLGAPDAWQRDQHGAAASIAALRMRYAGASGTRKVRAAQALDRAERRAALARIDHALEVLARRRCDVIAARRGRDLFGNRGDTAVLAGEAAGLRAEASALRRERRRLRDGGGLAFRFDAHFADVFARGGFSAIVGNPPWVRLHRIAPAERVALRARFTVMRHAAWSAGAEAAGAGAGFAGQADLSALFVERSLDLLQPGGTLALLLPSKLWTALAGGGVRRLLHTRATIRMLEDRTEAPELFDAVTYPSLLVAQRRSGSAEPPSVACEFGVHRGPHLARWCDTRDSVAFDDTDGSPWMLLPPPVRRSFDRVGRDTVPLGHALGRPVLGLKSGFNDAFLVRIERTAAEEGCVHVRDRSGRRGTLPATVLRPVVRGEQVRPWHVQGAAEHIVWTHDATGPCRTLVPSVVAWLGPHRARLTARSDTRGRAPWWTLHRVDGAVPGRARVLWADLARTPRAMWLPAGDPAVPLNTCYVLHCPAVEDAQAVAALMNSPLAAAWLRSIAEPARGGYRRLFAWTTALLPLPADWMRAREILAPLGHAGAAGQPPSPTDLLDAALDAYRIRRQDIAPLLEWQQAGSA